MFSLSFVLLYLTAKRFLHTYVCMYFGFTWSLPSMASIMYSVELLSLFENKPVLCLVWGEWNVCFLLPHLWIVRSTFVGHSIVRPGMLWPHIRQLYNKSGSDQWMMDSSDKHKPLWRYSRVVLVYATKDWQTLLKPTAVICMCTDTWLYSSLVSIDSLH